METEVGRVWAKEHALWTVLGHPKIHLILMMDGSCGLGWKDKRVFRSEGSTQVNKEVIQDSGMVESN